MAEDKVGYDVRVPTSVPPGFALRSVNAVIGPVGPDQDGIIRDLSHIRTVTLLYLNGPDTRLVIEQHAPEGSMSPPLEAVGIDSGHPGVEASLIQRTGVTHLMWNSPDATYLATLSYSDESVATDARDGLLRILASMR
jgi:hypothetical protein